MSLGVYRIVQEALTNWLKRTGPGSSGAVRVERDGERIELSTVDNGYGRQPPAVAGCPAATG